MKQIFNTTEMLIIASLIMAMPLKSKGQISAGMGIGATVQPRSVGAFAVHLQVSAKIPDFPIVASYNQIAHPNRITPSMFQMRVGFDVYKGITPYIGQGFHLKTSDDKENPENGWFNCYGIQYDQDTWFFNAGMAGKSFTAAIGCRYVFD